jgi:tetratricopeptide (TPR) repeat protein
MKDIYGDAEGVNIPNSGAERSGKKDGLDMVPSKPSAGQHNSRRRERFFRARGYNVAPPATHHYVPEDESREKGASETRPSTQTKKMQRMAKQQRTLFRIGNQEYDVKPAHYVLSDLNFTSNLRGRRPKTTNYVPRRSSRMLLSGKEMKKDSASHFTTQKMLEANILNRQLNTQTPLVVGVGAVRSSSAVQKDRSLGKSRLGNATMANLAKPKVRASDGFFKRTGTKEMEPQFPETQSGLKLPPPQPCSRDGGQENRGQQHELNLQTVPSFLPEGEDVATNPGPNENNDRETKSVSVNIDELRKEKDRGKNQAAIVEESRTAKVVVAIPKVDKGNDRTTLSSLPDPETGTAISQDVSTENSLEKQSPITPMIDRMEEEHQANTPKTDEADQVQSPPASHPTAYNTVVSFASPEDENISKIENIVEGENDYIEGWDTSKEDLVAKNMKGEPESAEIKLEKPIQKMSDTFEEYHEESRKIAEEDIISNMPELEIEPDTIAQIIMETDIEDYQQSGKIEEEESKDVSASGSPDADDSKPVDCKNVGKSSDAYQIINRVEQGLDADVLKVIRESEERVNLKKETALQGSKGTERDPFETGSLQEDPEKITGSTKSKDLLKDELLTDKTEKDKPAEVFVDFYGIETGNSVPPTDSNRAHKHFPTPDLPGIQEMLTPRDAATERGFSTAVFDEIEGLPSSANVNLHRQDPPRAQKCFEFGLIAESESKFDEAICWYSIGYGVELDSINLLEGPFEKTPSEDMHPSSKPRHSHDVSLQNDTAFALRCLLRRGELYQQMGILPQAKWDFARAMLLSPKMLVCVYHKARVEMEMGELLLSLNTLDLCIKHEIEDRHDKAIVSSLWTEKAEVYLRRHNTNDAVEALKKAISLNERNYGAYSILGDVLLNHKKINPDGMGAFEAYINCAKICPNDVNSVESLVNVATNELSGNILDQAIEVTSLTIKELLLTKEGFIEEDGRNENYTLEWISGPGWTVGGVSGIATDESIAHVFCQRARLYACQGRINLSKRDLKRAEEFDSNHLEIFLYRSALTHPEGLLSEAERFGLDKGIRAEDAYTEREFHGKHSLDEETSEDSKALLNGPEESCIEDLSRCLDLFPDSFDALVLRASIYTREKMHAAALHDLHSASVIDPDCISIYFEIARLNLQHFHDYHSALDAAQGAFQCYPVGEDRKTALFLRSEAYLRSGHTDEAISDYSRLIRDDPGDPWPYLFRAICLSRTNRGRLALYSFIAALKLFPFSRGTEARIGEAQIILSEYAEAVSTLKHAVKNSHDVHNLCLLGEALLGAGDMPGAVQVLQQAISENPNSTLGYNYLGKCMMKMKNYESALSYFDSAIDLDPRDPASYNNRGLCKTMLKIEMMEAEELEESKRVSTNSNAVFVEDAPGASNSKKSRKKKKKKKRGRRRKKAKPIWRDVDDKTLATRYEMLVGLDDFNKSLSLDKKCVEARLNRAEMYLIANRFNKALEDLDLVIKYDPSNVRALINRGVLHCNCKRYGAAIRDFDDSLVINEDSPLCYFNRGIAYSHFGDFQQAYSDYTNALELAPEAIAALRNRGLLQLQDGKFKEALQDLNQVMKAVRDTHLETSHADLISAVAHCELHANRLFPNALDAFHTAIEANPRAVEAYIGRGNVYLRLALRDEPLPQNLNLAVPAVPFLDSTLNAIEGDQRFMSEKKRSEVACNAQIASMAARSQAFRYWGKHAQKDFSHALRLNPKQVEARANLGFLLCVQGKFEAALRIFNGALNLFPHHRKALEGRALVHMHLHRYRESLEDINAALEDFDYQGPIGNIMDMIRVKNAMDKSKETYRASTEEEDIAVTNDNRRRTLNSIKRECECLVSRAVIKLNSGKLWAEASVLACNDLLAAINKGEKHNVPCPSAYYNYGTILLRHNKIEECISMMNKCIENSSDPFYLAHINRGIAYAIQDKGHEALEDFDYVISKQPSNIHVLYNRAVLRKRTKNYSQATADLNRAIMYAPDDAQMYVERGRVRAAQKKVEAAMKDFAIALQLDETVKL